jgi:hypothetical protein
MSTQRIFEFVARRDNRELKIAREGMVDHELRINSTIDKIQRLPRIKKRAMARTKQYF